MSLRSGIQDCLDGAIGISETITNEPIADPIKQLLLVQMQTLINTLEILVRQADEST